MLAPSSGCDGGEPQGAVFVTAARRHMCDPSCRRWLTMYMYAARGLYSMERPALCSSSSILLRVPGAPTTLSSEQSCTAAGRHGVFFWFGSAAETELPSAIVSVSILKSFMLVLVSLMI